MEWWGSLLSGLPIGPNADSPGAIDSGPLVGQSTKQRLLGQQDAWISSGAVQASVPEPAGCHLAAPNRLLLPHPQPQQPPPSSLPAPSNVGQGALSSLHCSGADGSSSVAEQAGGIRTGEQTGGGTQQGAAMREETAAPAPAVLPPLSCQQAMERPEPVVISSEVGRRPLLRACCINNSQEATIGHTTSQMQRLVCRTTRVAAHNWGIGGGCRGEAGQGASRRSALIPCPSQV